MKSSLTFIAALLFIVTAACDKTPQKVSVTGVSLDKSSLTITVGSSEKLTATVSPDNATSKTVRWKSDNESVATVDAGGNVKGKSAGQATVTVITFDGGKTANCAVTVKAKENQGGEEGGDEGDEGGTEGGGTEEGDVNGLTRQQAEAKYAEVIAQWKKDNKSAMQANLDRLYVADEKGHKMKFLVDCYGDEPEGGHSLWISLHGGGATTATENDGQWQNQQVMYRRANPPQPTEGYYISPRAFKDEWNMWWFKDNDYLFEQIIKTMVVLNDVNPDKVYLMGYSAGGDGVWRMAPRMADHWAAAAMMAGHPGHVSLLNVRNMPFTLWVGEKDKDYDRNTIVPQKAKELDELQKADPEGYIHSVNVVAGMPHWMELEDAKAFPWMAEYTRNPYPNRVVWRQEGKDDEAKEAIRARFYWIAAPANEVSSESLGKIAIANIDGNTVNIERCDYKGLTIYLNDKLVDLDKPVKVVYNGKTLFEGMVDRTEENIKASFAEREDPSYMFCSRIDVKI